MLSVLTAVFFIGLAAHGFFASNLIYSGDALAEVYMSESWGRHFISLGRYMTPVIDRIFGCSFAANWSAVIIGFLMISLSVYFVCRVFQISEKEKIILVGGIFVTNKTVITLVLNYSHLIVPYSCSLLLSVISFWFWHQAAVDKINKKSIVISVISLFVSLGIYQAFFPVTVSLIIIDLLVETTDKKDVRTIVKKGFIGAGIVLTAGILYACSLPLVSAVTNVPLETGSYHSLDGVFSGESLPGRLIYAYAVPVLQLTLSSYSVYSTLLISVVNLCLGILFVYTLVRKTRNNHLSAGNYLLTFMLVLILPLAMGSIRILTGTVYDLMVFSVWMFYLLPLVFLPDTSWIKRMIYVLIIFVIYSNCQSANAVYAKRVSDDKSTFAVMNNISYDLERTEGYVAGETPVFFVGQLSDQFIPVGTTYDYSRIFQNDLRTEQGMTDIDFYRVSNGNLGIVTYENKYGPYFNWYFQKEVNLIKSGNYAKLMELYEYYDDMTSGMPVYPKEGYIRWVDDVLVIRVGE